ncbi:MAG: DUF2314 domain-containing protein [Bacteroidota bacterium]
MYPRTIAIVVILMSLAACNNNQEDNGTVTFNKDSSDRTVKLSKHDRRFLDLQDSAQSQLHQFLDSFRIKSTDNDYEFLVKSAFSDSGLTEHMWSYVYDINGNNFEAILGNEPFTVQNIIEGDSVIIKSTAIEDWMIIDHKREKKYGHFSQEYLKSLE